MYGKAGVFLGTVELPDEDFSQLARKLVALKLLCACKLQHQATPICAAEQINQQRVTGWQGLHREDSRVNSCSYRWTLDILRQHSCLASALGLKSRPRSSL